MSKVYEIRTIQDIANLTEDQQEGFLQDLKEWLRMLRLHRELSPFVEELGVTITAPDDVIHWVDDGDWGRCSEININIKLGAEGEK